MDNTITADWTTILTLNLVVAIWEAEKEEAKKTQKLGKGFGKVFAAACRNGRR